MAVSIIHTLVKRVLGVWAPGTGRRRAGERTPVSAPDRVSEAPLAATSSLPAHRSPYGLHTPLDGAANAMVRPYLAAVAANAMVRPYPAAVERKRECAFQTRARGRTPSCLAAPARTRQFAEVH
ncbi:hypothetical protein [Streptomyces sp. NBC_01314]|uniref:hypothetical protein n=1 Tax=Streptomyces sp. NBC_01314 TaxID=2903821 RepID=UPI00308EEC7D|nr:hypothetical protein OG622_24055 [Streptomyces sp. NBC_01314]